MLIVGNYRYKVLVITMLIVGNYRYKVLVMQVSQQCSLNNSTNYRLAQRQT